MFDAMKPYMLEKFGNPSSLDHAYGTEASSAVEEARGKVAKCIGASASDIIFTSGATESDNLALMGVMERYADRGDHLVTCTTEHKAVLDVARHLEASGKGVTYLPVNEVGEINLEDLKEAITDKTVMVSIMLANNEVGTIADVKKIGEIVHDKGAIFHTDAAQAVGHMHVDVDDMNIDLMSFSAHKMYGPKGIGALYVRGIKPRIKLNPIIRGGGHEHNNRSGTLNVPGIVGFGKAIEISQNEMEDEIEKYRKWSKIIINAFLDAGGILNSPHTRRLFRNINMYFPGIENKAIINSISKQIAISGGSACTTETVEPSHVLLAMGFNEDRAHQSIRIGLGRHNTYDEIEFAVNEIIYNIKKLKKIN
ncbi:MAG: cysteine desulfurase [Alphaproteobacteria bacterium]|nr:cysteine desulfurase [Alphaproteobacteria bacterium]